MNQEEAGWSLWKGYIFFCFFSLLCKSSLGLRGIFYILESDGDIHRHIHWGQLFILRGWRVESCEKKCIRVEMKSLVKVKSCEKSV